MNSLLKVLKIAVAYWPSALLNILFNVLSIIFSVFSFVLIIPVLEILFDQTKQVSVAPPPIDFSFSALSNTDLLKENFYYFVSETVKTHGAADALLYISILLVGMFLFKNLFRYAANFFIAPLRNGVVKDLRNALYLKIMILPLAYFTEKRKGDIISRMSSDVMEVEWSILNSLEMIFREPLTIIIFLVTLFMMSPYLTVFVLIFLPIMGLIIGQVSKSLKKSSIRGQKQLGGLLALIEESLSGLRVIKGFTAIGFSKNRFEIQNDEYTKTMIGAFRKRDLAAPMSEFLGILVVMVILLYGGNLVLGADSVLSSSVFIAYLALFSQILTPAKSLSSAMYNVQKGAASMERIDVILDADEVIVEKKDAITVKEFEKEIIFDNVSFRYEEADVLKNINLKIQKGKTIALVGPSGAGKTTMADLLPRFYDVCEGALLIDGKDIRDFVIDDLRSLMGIVTQESILFNDTVFNNIALGIDDAKEEDVIYAAKIANAHEFIEKMPKGYHNNIGDSGAKLSGGQRQRLSIARAVLKNPPILVLDEATSALDTESERLVQDALETLMKNRTSVVIAHRLSTIRHADEIIVLKAGEIVERGNHETLFEANGTYRRLCDMQTFV